MSGVRSATLQVIATTTIAAYVSLGGLGRYVFDGQSQQDYPQMASGAVLVAVLAMSADFVLAMVQRGIVSRGISGRYAKGAGDTHAPDAMTGQIQVGWAILTEASLSFLGAGVPPPRPAWGSMVADGRNLLQTSWWVPIVPGAAILIVTIATNVVGDWLRDKFDPTIL